MGLIEKRIQLLEELEKVEREIRISKIPENELLIGKWIQVKDEFERDNKLYIKVKNQIRNDKTQNWIVEGAGISLQKDNDSIYIEIDRYEESMELSERTEFKLVEEKDVRTIIESSIEAELKQLWTS